MRSLVLLSAMLLAARASAGPLPDDALVTDGTNRFQAGDVEGALVAFDKAAKLSPRDARPRFLRGAVLWSGKKDAAAAIAEYRAALALDGKLADVRNELGSVLLDTGRVDEAIVELKAAVAANAKLGEAWFNLGRAHRERGDLDAAVAAYRAAAPLMPKDADVRIDLSIALRKLHREAESLAAAREAVQLAAGSAQTHLNLGFALQGAGKLDEAQGEMVAATRLAPDDAVAWSALAAVEVARKKYDAAVAALDHAEKLRPSAPITVERARIWQARGDVAKAIAVLEAASAKSPRSLALRIALATTFAAAKRCDEAEKALGALPPAQEDVKRATVEVRAACKKK